MKTKTITKEFYTTKRDFDFLNLDTSDDYLLRLCKEKEFHHIARKPDSIREFKITISFELPEKTITISESEFDEIVFKSKFGSSPIEYVENIKQKLFGG
jgi:hypothetical protein